MASGTAPEPVRLEDGVAVLTADPNQPKLRPYQRAAITAVESEFAAGRKRTLLVLPTGTGKTVCFAELGRRVVTESDKRVLVIAQRTELLDQAEEKFANIGVRASIEQADRRASSSAKVVIASVQTLRGPRLKRFLPDDFGLVVIDEAHHAPAQSYKSILEHFGSSLVVGCTATPDRADGKALGKIFESVAFTYEMRKAITDKWLVPLRARRVIVGDLDLSSIRVHHGDFDQVELARVLSSEKALHGVVGPLVQLAGRRKTLAFAVDVAHAHAIAEILNRHRMGSAMALDGNAPAAQRRAVLALFRKGAFQYLVNCALFTEGFDEPSIECIALLRPTLSRGLYTQMIGRGMRLSESTGKEDCLALDFAGNTARHRLAGPADALAGHMLDDDELAEIEKAFAGSAQVDMESVLAAADAEVARKRADVFLVALATYRTKEVNPFIGDFMPKLDPNSPRGREPATEAQLDAIVKAGFSKPPPGLTKGEASEMLDAVSERRKAGLCSVPQCQLLERLGLDTRTMTASRAAALFSQCRARGFRKYTVLFEPEYRRGKKAS